MQKVEQLLSQQLLSHYCPIVPVLLTDEKLKNFLTSCSHSNTEGFGTHKRHCIMIRNKRKADMTDVTRIEKAKGEPITLHDSQLDVLQCRTVLHSRVLVRLQLQSHMRLILSRSCVKLFHAQHINAVTAQAASNKRCLSCIYSTFFKYIKNLF
jgi:hypothetical protein